MGGEVSFKLLDHHSRIERVMRVISEEKDQSVAAKKLGISTTLLGFYAQAGCTVPEVREMLKGYTPELPFAAVVELGTVEPNRQLKLAKEIAAKHLSSEAAVQLIRAAENGNGTSHPSPQPESQKRQAGGSVAEEKSAAAAGEEPDGKDDAGNGEGSSDTSEFAAADSFLGEAGIDSRSLDTQAILEAAAKNGDGELPPLPLSETQSPRVPATVAAKEPEKGKETEKEMAVKKTGRGKRTEKIRLDVAATEAIKAFQKGKDLPTFVEAVRELRRIDPDLQSSWKIAGALGMQYYQIKDKMLFFDLKPRTQKLLLAAKANPAPRLLKKLLAYKSEEEQAEAIREMGAEPGERTEHEPPRQRRETEKILTEGIDDRGLELLENLPERFEKVMGEVVKISELPPWAIKGLAETAAIQKDRLQVALDKLRNFI